jgi:hypothetical protein
MKHLTPALLRWVANGVQGQNALHTVFPLNTGRWFFIGWWRKRNRSVELQSPMGSRMKRSVAYFFLLFSRRDSKKPNGAQAGHRPSEKQILFLVPMEGSGLSLARSALVLPGWSGSKGRRTAGLPSQGKPASRARRLPAATLSAVMVSPSSSSSQEHAAVCCPACFPFVFPVRGRPVQGKDADLSWVAGPVATAQV